MSYISASQAKQIAQKAVDNLKDGTLVPKLADNLTPYAEDSGTTQTQPFFLEGTATGNGESRVDAKQVPAFAFLQEKRGNMVCVNQMLNSVDFPATTTVNGITFTNNADGTITVNGTATANASISLTTITSVSGHTYFMSGCPDGGSDSTYSFDFGGGYKEFGQGQIITPSAVTRVVGIQVYSGTTVSNLVFRPKLVDLTQWFNGNIPAYLLSHPEAFGRYYKGSLTYEPGRLEPATGRYLTSVGRNIWDEEWEVGIYNASASTVIKTSDTTHIRSKNPIRVTPDTEYYMYSSGINVHLIVADDDGNVLYRTISLSNGTFITPAGGTNVYFNMAASYGTTYNHDITISLYYSGESGYDKYYPHEVLATIDTGTESLYSAGSAYDSKVPSGLITRRIGSYTFTGNENWSLFATGSGTWYSEILANIAKFADHVYVVSDGLTGQESGGGLSYSGDGDVWLQQVPIYPRLYVHKSDAVSITDMRNYTQGKTVYFELATPTTEQGTPFQENIPIDDFGQLSWSNTDVPQGNQIFYPVDYKAYEDTLIKYTDGDATSLVRKTDYASYSTGGTVRVYTSGYNQGIKISPSGFIFIQAAEANQIKDSSPTFNPIVTSTTHLGTFYGLSRAAGANLASSTAETAPDGTNPGVYPASAIQAILKMLLPATPTTDGTYDLVCTVTNGEPTFSWVART